MFSGSPLDPRRSDVPVAYLHGEIDGEVYMEPPLVPRRWKLRLEIIEKSLRLEAGGAHLARATQS